MMRFNPFIALPFAACFCYGLEFSRELCRGPFQPFQKCNCHATTLEKFHNTDHHQACCCVEVLAVPNFLPKDLNELTLVRARFTAIKSADFNNYPNLSTLIVEDAEKLTSIDGSALSHKLEQFHKISITRCPKLTTFLNIDSLLNRTILTMSLTHTGLEELPKLRTLEHLNNIVLDFSHNKIERLPKGSLENLTIHALRLSHNKIVEIDDYFLYLSSIVHLRLDNNPIMRIGENAFSRCTKLDNLNLSYTQINRLPENGMEVIKVLNIEEVQNLKKFPSVYVFKKLVEARLTYPYHCCYFRHAADHIEKLESEAKEHSVEKLWAEICSQSSENYQLNVSKNMRRLNGRNAHDMIIKSRHQEAETKNFSEIDTLDEIHGKDTEIFLRVEKDESKMDSTEIYEDHYEAVPHCHYHGVAHEVEEELEYGPDLSHFRHIKCTPEPDALNPCEDMINYRWLRVAIWFVWILAVVGNATVILVLSACGRQFKQHVNHFLIVNLACADFLIGTYLAILAVKDVASAGHYHNHAVDWQTGLGCQLAGFLAVFASELSIFSMVLISVEVWYNTKYIFYGRRFQLKAAVLLVGFSYSLALVAAFLPLTGTFSTYSSTSTCLPLRFEFLGDKIFIFVLLGFNMSAFIFIVFNYVAVYKMVSGSCTTMAHRQNVAIARRMAILIGTDFLCWAPIIFFGLCSAFGLKSLISVSSSKILLILFFPINAFANPFLYVFLTKMFRKDMSALSRKYACLRSFSTRKRATNTNGNVVGAAGFNIRDLRRSWSNALFNSSQTLLSFPLSVWASRITPALGKKGSGGSGSTRMSDWSVVHQHHANRGFLSARRKSGPERIPNHMHMEKMPLSTFYFDSPPGSYVELRQIAESKFETHAGENFPLVTEWSTNRHHAASLYTPWHSKSKSSIRWKRQKSISAPSLHSPWTDAAC